jgi:hypothetical protein
MCPVKFLALALSLFSAAAFADGNDPTNTLGSTPVVVAASQAANFCVESNVAAAAQAIATVPAQAGMFFYVTNLEVSLIAIAAPVATLMATTSSNLPGSLPETAALPNSRARESRHGRGSRPMASSCRACGTQPLEWR